MKSRKRTWIVLGIAIALAVSAFVKREDILTAWSIRKARQSLQAHRSDAARVFIEEVLTANPDHPEAHFLMARMYRRKGMYPDFSRHLKRAMDLGYSTDSLQLEQRMAMAQEGRVSEVEAELVKAMDGTQRDSDICEAMVTGYFVSYQFNKGRSLLDAWRGDFPDEPQIYFLEAKFEEYRDEMSSAIRNYRKVLRLDPGRWDARLELARALGEEHKYDEAEELLAQCLDNEPASMKVLSAQAHVFTEQAKVDPARETWEKVLQLDDGHVEARFALARIAMEADNPRKANV